MKKEVKIGIGLVFLAFYVFLIMQFGKVFVYYDDFGYLSLSYGNTVPDVIGSNYTLSQLLSFMGKHYFYSNGRLFYLFLFSFLNMTGGPGLYGNQRSGDSGSGPLRGHAPQ